MSCRLRFFIRHRRHWKVDLKLKPDVDLDAATLRVNRSLECVGADNVEGHEKRKPELRFKEPKTAGSRRSIPLPSFAIDRLRQHRREQRVRFEQLSLWQANDSLVFDRAGEPWNPNTFGTEFAKRARLYKLPPVRLHDLRHSYASLMLESGVDLKTVSTALGHSTIRITADTTRTLRQRCSSRRQKGLTG